MNATRQFSALFLGAAIALAAAPATAQTVGEILDKGGQKLDAAAARAIVPGVTFTGTNAAGFVGKTEFKADGTVAASGTRPSDNRSNSGSGTWSVDDSGKVCSKIQWNGGGTGGACNYWFKQGEDYYTAQSDARDQAAVKRAVPK